MDATHAPYNGINVDTIISRLPSRLEDAPFDIFDELSPRFEHRRRTCRPQELVNYLGASVTSRAIEMGDTSEPAAISEFEAIDTMIQALHSKYPSWFGAYESAGIDPTAADFSDAALTGSGIRDDYFGPTLDPETHDINPERNQSVRRVAVPFTAFVLVRIADHMRADTMSQRAVAKREIRQTIMREAHSAELDERDLAEAYNDALARLQRTD